MHEFRAQLDWHVSITNRVYPSAHTIARLQQDDFAPGLCQVVCGSQSGNPRANNYNRFHKRNVRKLTHRIVPACRSSVGTRSFRHPERSD